MADKLRSSRSEALHKRYDPIKMYSSLIGEKYWLLTITGILPHRNSNGRPLCVAKCECGVEREFNLKSVLSGSSKSCGFFGYKSRVLSSDLSGKLFGYLRALYPTDKRDSSESVMWRCRCEYPGCGRELDVSSTSLKSGHSKSCGHCGYKRSRIDAVVKKYYTDDEKYLASILEGMRIRCYCQSHNCFKNYGGRGIYICDEWLADPFNFINWAMNNGYSRGLFIDRVDVNGPYAPWNCVWSTATEQANNTTRTHYITIGTQSASISEWANYLGVNYDSLYGSGRYSKDDSDVVAKILEIAKSKGIPI